MGPVEILQTLLVLALIGFAVWLIITYIPMPDIFQKVFMVVVAVLLIYWMITLVAGGGSPNLGFHRIP